MTVHQFFCILHFLSHLFPLPCGFGSTVPREGFDSSVTVYVEIYAGTFFRGCEGADF